MGVASTFRQLLPSARTPATDPGERLYVIGDVHGQRDLLLMLFDLISLDNADRGRSAAKIIMLGDLIDRGAHSAQLLRALSQFRLSRKLLVLRGNHESTLLAVRAGDADAASEWVRFGGDATLASFGMDRAAIDADRPDAIIAAVRALIPPDIISWLASLPLCHRNGDYFFAHAGIRPGVRLSRQDGGDLLWIRDEFLDSDRDHGAVIVHGHSVTEDGPTIAFNRIGIDTGAYRTGRLTALGLEGTERWTLEAFAPHLVS